MKVDIKELLSDVLSFVKGDTAWNTVNAYIKYKKNGGNVTVCGSSSGQVTLPTNAWANLGTLPVGYRPLSEIIFTAMLRGNNQPAMARVGTDGVVSIYNGTSTAQNYWIYNVTFPI